MISSVSLALVVVGGGAAADTVPPADLVARARALVAAEWRQDSQTVALEWGRIPTLPSQLAAADLTLAGRGRDGWYVLTVTPPSQRPVAVTLRAGVSRLMPVAARQLPVGTRLAADDIVWQPGIAWGPPDTAGTPDRLGWQVRRSLAAGQPLEPPRVRPPELVSAGEPVTFVWQRGTVRMERIAVAQGPGRLGDRVRARIGDVRLTGRVVGEGMAIIEESIE